jgi:hypothetical protein
MKSPRKVVDIAAPEKMPANQSYIVYNKFIPLQSLNPCGEARSRCYMNTLPVPRKRP